MAYATATDLEDFIPDDIMAELTDDDITDGEAADTDLIDRMLERATSRIDSYIGQVYDVPLANSEVPESIKEATMIMAKRFLYGRRNMTTEDIRQEYVDIKEWLQAIANGDISLHGVDSLDDELTEDGFAGLASKDDLAFKDSVFE